MLTRNASALRISSSVASRWAAMKSRRRARAALSSAGAAMPASAGDEGSGASAAKFASFNGHANVVGEGEEVRLVRGSAGDEGRDAAGGGELFDGVAERAGAGVGFVQVAGAVEGQA